MRGSNKFDHIKIMIENFRIVKGLWLLMNAVNYFILYFVLVSIMVKEIRTSIG